MKKLLTLTAIFCLLSLGACSNESHLGLSTQPTTQIVSPGGAGDGDDPAEPTEPPAGPDLKPLEALNDKAIEIQNWLRKNAVEVIDKKDWWVDANLLSVGLFHGARAKVVGEGRSFNTELRLYKIVIHTQVTQALAQKISDIEHVEKVSQGQWADSFIDPLFYTYDNTCFETELKPLRDAIVKLRDEYLALRESVVSRRISLDEEEEDLLESIGAQFGNVFLRLVEVKVPEDLHAYSYRCAGSFWFGKAYSVFDKDDDVVSYSSHWAQIEDLRFF